MYSGTKYRAGQRSTRRLASKSQQGVHSPITATVIFGQAQCPARLVTRRDRHADISTSIGSTPVAEAIVLTPTCCCCWCSRCWSKKIEAGTWPAVSRSFWRRSRLVGGLIHQIIFGWIGAKLGYTLRKFGSEQLLEVIVIGRDAGADRGSPLVAAIPCLHEG